MDRIDHAFFRVFRDATDRRAIIRYGVAGFRQRIRQHLQKGARALIQIVDHEPDDMRGAMLRLAAAWESDGHAPQYHEWLGILEERKLFGPWRGTLSRKH